MRSAARRSAASAAGAHAPSAAAISAAGTRSVSGVRSSRSKRLVYSITASSPRARTAARIAATASSTRSSTSRLPSSKAAKAAAKSGCDWFSLSGIRGLAKAFDPIADLAGPGLERGTIDDQPRGNLRDLFDLHQIVRLQRRAGLHQIDDLARQTHAPVSYTHLRAH